MKINKLAAGCYLLFASMIVAACNSEIANPVSGTAFNVEFVEHAIPDKMIAGEKLTAKVMLRNTSERKWWSKPNHNRSLDTNLTYRWLDQERRMVVRNGLKTALPRDLDPGNALQVETVIQAPEQPGNYILQVSPIQEAVARFTDKGASALEVVVRVVKQGLHGDGASMALSQGAVGVAKGEEVASGIRVPDAQSVRTDGHVSRQQGTKTDVQKAIKFGREGARSQMKNSGPIWSVQVSSFESSKSAARLVSRLRRQGHDAHLEKTEIRGKEWYRVRIGRLATRTEAESLQYQLKQRGEEFKSSFIASS